MSQLKYKLATGFPVISLTYSEYVHLQFARQRQPGDWIEWPSMGRDTRQMLSHLLDVEKVRFIGQRNDGAIRIITLLRQGEKEALHPLSTIGILQAHGLARRFITFAMTSAI